MIHLTAHSHRTFTIPLRRPFRFGMVELRELEHLMLRATITIDGDRVEGIAGENLAPKWFTKDAVTSLADDVTRLHAAIDAVADLARATPPAATPSEWCRSLHRRAADALPQTPPLVRQLGVSLFERCAIDAACRRADQPFHQLLHGGALGVEPTDLPPTPSGRLHVRHTVGLSDPIDELPALLRPAGIRRLKIKLCGDAAADIERLVQIERAFAAGLLERVTLDGNENYADATAVAQFLRLLRSDKRLPRIRSILAWIEQPLHRAATLHDDVRPLLTEFAEFPHVIDESDDDPSSLPRALSLGYAGAAHKNCKGVFKSIVARSILAEHGRRTGKATILSGEDLTIVAPWSQVQDLAVAAAVGVVDVERNGQHYADGLSAFPQWVSGTALAEHPLLYERDGRGVVTLRIRDGQLDLRSVNAAGFGSAVAWKD